MIGEINKTISVFRQNLQNTAAIEIKKVLQFYKHKARRSDRHAFLWQASATDEFV